MIVVSDSVEGLVEIAEEMDEKTEVFGLEGSGREKKKNIFLVGGEEVSRAEKLADFGEKVVFSFLTEMQRGLGSDLEGRNKNGELFHIDNVPGPRSVIRRLELCNICPTSLELNEGKKNGTAEYLSVNPYE